MKKILLIFLTLLLTGCYNYHELNDINIASSIIFDYKDNEYKVYIKINGYEDKINGSGKSINEAMNNANMLSSKDLSYYHLNTVFITNNINLENVLLYLIRNPRINNSFYIVYIDDINIFNNDTDINNVYDMLKKEFNITFFDIANIVFNDNIDFYFPVINNELKLSGIMTYDGYEKAKFLDLDDLNTLKILNQNINSSINMDKIQVNINSINTNYIINDNFKINIDIKVDIVEDNSNINNKDFEDIKELEGLINDKVNYLILDLINKLIENNTDILGFDRYIFNKNHNLNKNFKDFKYTINVNTKINKKGLILK